MKPVIWSDKSYIEDGVGWHRGGTDIQYYRGRLKRTNYRNPCYCMSFTYEFKYEDDKVYFAYSLPYTFSMLSSFISEIEKVQNLDENNSSPIVKIESAGCSLSGVSIPMITITDFACKSPKKTILMNGRMHPGETHASWVFHGLIHFLLSK